MSEPIPVLPLNYATPAPRRPGIITAIGVLSIVIGSLGIITNGKGVLTGVFGFMVMSQFARTAGVGAAPGPTSATGNVWVMPVPNAMSAGTPAPVRPTVINGLTRVRKLSADRIEQLDTLLSEISLFPDDATADTVAAAVTDSGTKSGEDYFLLPQGGLSIGDYSATFTAPDGTLTQLSSGMIFGPKGQGYIPAAHIDSVVKEVGLLGATLNTAQEKALRDHLSTPGQQLISPLPTVADVADQITAATADPDGGVTLTSTHNFGASLTFSPAGAITATAGTPFNFPQFSLAATLTSAALSLLSAGLAVYLLVIGILVLRRHPKGARLHRIFAWIKIPLVLLAGAASTWMMFPIFSMATSMGPATGGVSTFQVLLQFLLMVGLGVALGLAYPVALLIALRTRTLRDYYSSARVA